MESNFRETAQELLRFIAAGPSPFHAVDQARRSLEAAGFKRLGEEDSWALERGGRYCVTRNDSSLAAFIVGTAPPEEAGFRLIGAHTDSPTLRVKPNPVIERHGYIQLGVEVYGGAVLATWLDRDLGLAGRVLLENGSGTESRLFQANRPVARIPGIAIHLDREVNEKGLVLNRENHLPPVIGLGQGEGWNLHAWLAAEVGVAPERILDSDLILFDLNPPTFAGIHEEFLLAARLDNLASSFSSLQALLGTANQETAATRVIALYDNEEIGSSTRQGAAGTLLGDLLSRVVDGPVADVQRAKARSFLLSADMAHAVHPNYADRHESRHLPRLNGGPVVKYNANARYATDAASAARFFQICREAEVPVQKYVNRADLACGSTIGPIVSTQLGVPTVDIGNAMLSMHSCREMAGSLDPLHMIRAMSRFFVRS